MNASVDLSEQELAELQELTQESEPTNAVRVAMTEYLRYARRMRLKQASGLVTMEENWESLEENEGKPGE